MSLNPRSLRAYDVVDFKYHGVQYTKITVRNVAVWGDWFGCADHAYYDRFVTDLKRHEFKQEEDECL